MNGKVCKLLRKNSLNRKEYREGKKDYNKLTHDEKILLKEILK